MSSSIRGPVRVRFAPSPTGFLHVGGARTAIYNELLRQSVGGAFVLRIEDTDRERSDAAMTRQIQDSLAWTGVRWDEGPFLQSERVERHREAAADLVARGRAYRCFCTPEALAEARAEAEKGGGKFLYPGTCRSVAADESARRAAAGEPFVVRLRMPADEIRIPDLVRGEVVFPGAMFDDFVLLRSDGSPTYHLSVVVDDVDMNITHVIRGEDHLSNTPKHVRLFEALGASVPTFGHLPLILGPDKKRLSKRTGATSTEEFRAQGILPEALYNYLALLGWSPGDDREIFSREELVAAFTVERLGASAAVFDVEKLLWVNSQHLWALDLGELLGRLDPFLDEAGLAAARGTETLARAAALHQIRARTLAELAGQLGIYFAPPAAWDEELSRKYAAKTAGLPAHLETLAAAWRALPSFDKEALEASLRELAEAGGLKAGELIHPTRMALSGEKAGPPLFDLVELLGREETASRLAAYRDYLSGLA